MAAAVVPPAVLNVVHFATPGYGPNWPGNPTAVGATAGTPGTWQPAGCVPPANAAGATGKTATPPTAWTVGQYVQGSTSGTAGQMHWTGTAWAAGKA